MSNDFWKDYEPEPTKPAPMTKDEALDLAMEALKKLYGVLTIEEIEPVDKAITAIKQARSAPVQDQSMFDCGVQARPLSHPLRAYHIAMSEGPLHYEWTDKPHRLVYDLIAAVRFYANRAAPVQEPVKDNSNYRLDPPEAEPAQRQWVGLTDELRAGAEPMFFCGAKWAERILKEKNT